MLATLSCDSFYPKKPMTTRLEAAGFLAIPLKIP